MSINRFKGKDFESLFLFISTCDIALQVSEYHISVMLLYSIKIRLHENSLT